MITYKIEQLVIMQINSITKTIQIHFVYYLELIEIAIHIDHSWDFAMVSYCF